MSKLDEQTKQVLSQDLLTIPREPYGRKQMLREAGGKHSPKQLSEILTLQKRRCIYCNVKFTKSNPATRDHFFAVSDGGANWGVNLVMACRSCNSRRCDIPFRTFCKLLSPTQNRRILRHLCNRLLALDFDHLPSEELLHFEIGLAAHDPLHWRYRDIQRWDSVKRRYAAQNKLLPRTAVAILRRVPYVLADRAL